MAKKKTDWKYVALISINIATILMLAAAILMFVTPLYRNAVARDTGVLAYRQCQQDIAKAIVEDLNTAGFTQLTIGDQKIKLGQVQ